MAIAAIRHENVQLYFSCIFLLDAIGYTMAGREKLLRKFLSKPKDFTYNELRSLLRSLGYLETVTGRTSGSRVAFVHEKTKHILRLHKPHPANTLRRYQLDYLESELESTGAIK